jgi:hypothetical protein
MLDDWDPPTSLEEAYEDRRLVIAEIQDIQAQLGNRKKKSTYSDPDKYWAWRQGAVVALTNRLQELRLVKKWIRQNSKITNHITIKTKGDIR